MTKTASTVPSSPTSSQALASRILARISGDLGTMLGHELVLGEPRLESARTRPAGAGCVHISFKLVFTTADGSTRCGCLLVPLPDAVTMACSLLMVPDAVLEARREESSLDAPMKDAMLEIGHMIGGAVHSALAGLVPWSVRSAGCQGVRADVRPAFPYVEGSPLVVARVTARLGNFPASEHVLVLPELG